MNKEELRSPIPNACDNKLEEQNSVNRPVLIASPLGGTTGKTVPIRIVRTTNINSKNTESPFDINPTLTANERKLVLDILKTHPRAFAGDPEAPPATSPGVSHRIELKDNTPNKQSAYRQSPLKQAAVSQNTKTLLKRGLIERSNSPWSSPVVLVPKPHVENQWRMCIDFRKLNAQTKKDAYPIPLIEQCLDTCKDADYFTLIDIKDAFHHIPMDESSKPLTAFVTPDGLFQWKYMPFGLTNAPATFQRYVDSKLQGLLGKCCTAFFDDCLVYTTGSLEQHMKDVESVLARLTEARLEASLTKCKFAYQELLFIGHLISKGRVKPDPLKVRAVQDFPIPKNLSELRSFLGLMNYYHRFIQDYARIALPLYYLTRKGVKYEWSGVCDTAFNRLKKALLSAPCLRTPNFRAPFVLQTDASKEGIAGVLTQEFDGEEHPIAYISRQLNKAEKNYSGTELECLAVVWSIGQFEHYLLDAPFTLVTDHSALQWMSSKKFENTRIMRWILKLQEFTFNVQHRAGSKNANADALSRVAVPGSAPPDDSTDDPAIGPFDQKPRFVRLIDSKKLPYPVISDPVPVRDTLQMRRVYASTGAQLSLTEPLDSVVLVDQGKLEKLATQQRAEPFSSELIDYLEKKEIPARFSPEEQRRFALSARDYILIPQLSPCLSVLCYSPARPRRGLSSLTPIVPRIVVPFEFRRPILHSFHNSPFGGHFGIKRTLRKVMTNHYWPTMSRDVENWVKNCIFCTKEKALRKPEKVPYGFIVPPTAPFELISIDFVGPMKHKSEDFHYILVIIDHFTRWAITVPTKGQTAEIVAQSLLDEVYNRFGVPKRLLSDRGSVFIGELLTALNKHLGITRLLTSSHHPQTNGMVERFNSTLKDTLGTLVEEYGTQWVHILQSATFAYNTSKSEATGFTPYYALYGREAITPGDQLAITASELDDTNITVPAYISFMLSNLRSCHEFIQTVFKNKEEHVLSERLKRARILVYAPGDLVWVQNPQADSKTRNQIGRVPRWKGPATILERRGELSYLVEFTSAKENFMGLTKYSTVNVRNLRPFFSPLKPPSDESSVIPDELSRTQPYRATADSPSAIRLPTVRDPLPPLAPVAEDDDVDMSIQLPEEEKSNDEEMMPSLIPPDLHLNTPEDPYLREGYRPPTLEMPTSTTTAAGPAAAAKRRRATLPTPIYDETFTSRLPRHDKEERYSLPRRSSPPKGLTPRKKPRNQKK